MKHLYFLLLILVFKTSDNCLAQDNMGVGTQSPDASAVLDLTSSDKGLLVPRMSAAQRTAIAAPATGLLVYDTDGNTFWYFDGTQWVQAIGPQGPQGPAGANGVTGAQGPAGPQGIAGSNGPTGPTGVQGTEGATGATGPQGPSGTQGATGPQGLVGPTGLQGPTGATGPAGSNASVPAGVIVMWSGAIANIPSGFALCDGTNGTPDLTDRFVVSVPNSSTNPGTTGGSNSTTLSVAQLPSHNHTASGNTSTTGAHAHTGTTNSTGAHTHTLPGYHLTGGGSQIPWYNWSNSQYANNTNTTSSSGDHSHSLNISSAGDHLHSFNVTTSSTGSGSAIDNRPKYYALAFIMKL